MKDPNSATPSKIEPNPGQKPPSTELAAPPWTNPHHLNLFYFVARFGGFTAAARAMPYGIQQPAISKQIAELEEHVGVKLFNRENPLRLTEAGRRLFEQADRFFTPLPALIDDIRRPGEPLVRLGASELILHEHLPPLLHELRSRAPDLRFSIRGGSLEDLAEAVKAGLLDVAIAIAGTRPSGVDVLPLGQLPLVLLAHYSGSLLRPNLRQPGEITTPLICPGSEHTIGKTFLDELERRRVRWKPTIVANSIALVSWFAGQSHGFGLCLDLPVLVRHQNVEVIPLEDFPPVEIVAFSRHDPTADVTLVMNAIKDCGPALCARRDPDLEDDIDPNRPRIWQDPYVPPIEYGAPYPPIKKKKRAAAKRRKPSSEESLRVFQAYSEGFMGE